jgi:hypothetical protein
VLADEAVFSIARDFTRREIKTTRGATLWHPEVLASMLRSPRMAGLIRHGDRLYPAVNFPAIFDRETWERICAKLEHKPAAPSETRLLSNIARCGICSNHLRGSGSGNPRGTRGRDPDEFAYRCRNKTRIRDGGACGRLQITGTLADDEVTRQVVPWLSKRENVEGVLLRHANPAEVAQMRAREAELTDSRALLFDAHFTPPPGVPRLPDSVYYEKLKVIEDERFTIHRSLNVTREVDILKEVMEMTDVAAGWDSRPIPWRRAVLKLVTSSIVVEPRGKGEPGVRPDKRRFDPTRIKITFADE